MGDYSFVKDETGKVVGIWANDPKLVKDRMSLMALHCVCELPTKCGAMILLGDYRVVPNTFDRAGGWFVMLGSALAPGEVPGTGGETQPKGKV